MINPTPTRAEVEALLPCPFCGSTNVSSSRAMNETWVLCHECFATSRACSKHEAAIAAWNRRATLAPQAAPVAEGKPTQEMRETALELAQTIADHSTHFCTVCGQYGDQCICPTKPHDRFRDATAKVLVEALTVAAQKAALEAEARCAEMRRVLKPFTEIALLRDERPGDIDIIDAPDLAITPNPVKILGDALAAFPQPEDPQ